MGFYAMGLSAKRYAGMAKRSRMVGAMMETRSMGMDAAVSVRLRTGGLARGEGSLLCAMRYVGMVGRFIHL